MKHFVLLIFLLAAAGISVTTRGQSKANKNIITGYVTDRDYYPVVGALVMVDQKATNITTDEKGFYKVRITNGSGSIGIYSSDCGIITEIIGGRTRINFRYSVPLSPVNNSGQVDVTSDNDQVNIGYSKIDRRNLTTSVSSIDGTDSRFASYTSVYEMLKGTVPGVLVNGNKVLIRGFTTMFGSNEPLYVVDGIPVSSLDDLSPRLVKSIEVLKGPAAAIYGSRGANGVILVDLIDAPDIGKNLPLSSIKVPFADTHPASDVRAGSAILNGLVNPNDKNATVTFEYGINTDYGNKIQAIQNPVSGDSSARVSAIVDGLMPGATYHYRVVASNSFGQGTGYDVTFTTKGGVPEAGEVRATNTTPWSVQLNGTVNPHDIPTRVAFEYGTDLNYGMSIAAMQDRITGGIPVSVSATLTGLQAGTLYHFRMIAENEKGTVKSEDAVFRAQYVPGEFINGGYIFYIDKTGEHGLVCAPSDLQQTSAWGNCIPAGAAGKAPGTGKTNTEEIIRGCNEIPTAAGLCHDLVMNGYNDWFLPSVDELQLMYRSLHEKGLGGFKETYYWSSTQDKYGAWVVSFYYGNKSNQNRDRQGVLIRPVRAF
ncbi:MAG: TonB-dependent receptor plug domain-containing protein [Bacteroidales bacterium]|nr:TonB-dependent receptor plug domain-containing protein [Bacteroidales bacterium]